MYWLEISVRTDGEGAEAVAEVLRPFAYQASVVLEQLGDDATADPDALEAVVTVKIYVAEADDSPALRRRVEEILYHMGRLYPIPEPVFRELADEDWANAWKEHYHPFRLGRRLKIWPTWLPRESDNDVRPDDVVLVLDPGMAFGTGLHPTTQGCLRALEDIVRPGMSVLDAGTGSGILAVAAAKLGAAEVAAFDTDALAVRATADNAAQNGVGGFIHCWRGELESVRAEAPRDAWDVVVANILAPVIIQLLEEKGLLDYVTDDGRLILSGIILEQGAAVEAAIDEAGGRVERTITAGDWVTYIAGRR
ncbi:MAG: 50S ribosomal protein L11 methyltransferase [Anaerolineae bacterium]|uniref:50S ribosomal protein L11 methyltransferase n=1 Tax=Promineifilum sp. TaxID=2664178 RepID=UPI001DC718EA|nr:50S ribosomal protein L11 methyltransferase [Anaerolineales bacterium]MCB8934132.1 50S ribosomal protein L11 methyltransferase [Promineifilum sp.]MCO5179754.1 50S ribosomal protein L11 methyltransferase [Promineifilum sp.]MCW5845686.1 50S ribosomal protein L11 methyltransferase [Anaerolineae bacterium]